MRSHPSLQSMSVKKWHPGEVFYQTVGRYIMQRETQRVEMSSSTVSKVSKDEVASMRIKEASTMEVVLRRIVLESTTIEVASNI